MTASPELFIIGVMMGLTGAGLFGISNIVYKSQSSEIKPVAINSYKMWITLPVILITVFIFLFPTGFNVPLISVPFLMGSIILGAGIGDMVYLTSQVRLGVSRAFPIAMSFPIITYFLSIWLLNEPILLTRLIGVILTVIGISLISHETSELQGIDFEESSLPDKRTWDLLGISLALLAAVSWAFATIILQIGLVNADPIDANLIRILTGSIFLLPIFLIARKRGMSMPSKRATKLTLIAGFFGMGLGSILYVTAVKYTGAAVMSVVAATAPLFALPFSVIFLKEKITSIVFLGTILSVLGIVLVISGF